MSGGNEDNNLPRDAKVVMSLLKSMGVEEYEPRVVHQLLEFWYRYVVDVLSDAQTYSDHASKPVVDSDDVKLAIQTRVNSSFSQPPPREVLMELARSRNKVPLPKATPGLGIPLPPEEDTLVFPNYQLMVPKRAEMVEEEEDVEDAGGTGSVNVGSTQEQLGQPQQRVSFPLTAAKRPRSVELVPIIAVYWCVWV